MLIPVILSGGAGTRLWPASRSERPKPFLKLGDASLLYRTLDRALRVSEGPVLTVTAAEHRFQTRDEYALHPEAARHELGFLLEPLGRNTAPAILLAASRIARQHGEDAVLLVLPADHLIEDTAAFAEDAQRAAALARDGWLTTFGIVPNRPETGFGYLKRGATIGDAGYAVEAFVEKPDHATAQQYLARGDYLWNAGMFALAAGEVLEVARKVAPELAAAVAACDASRREEADDCYFDRATFAALPTVSFDYAIMEHADRVALVPARFDWHDVGSWHALGELDGGEADQRGNRVIGEAVLVDADNCYIDAGERLVAAVGVDNLVVVDSGDAVLVADRAHAQDVREVVDQLRKANHPAARVHATVHRPWGSYTVLEDRSDCKVKRLTVKPGGILSLQRHQRRSEHWTVVSGTARVRVGEEESLLERNQSTYIPMNTLHRLENPTDSDLHLIEVQCGDYFGEDDIERLEDVYGRR